MPYQQIKYKAIVAALLGNILETYDYSLYGYFAPLIAAEFFPSGNALASLLITFGVFAAGFFMRPLGAIIFGHLGDRLGRKTTLVIVITLMTIPTVLIGLLPTHAQIGITAGILLTVCRLVQGLAVGGEFTNAMVYIIEHAPSQQRGFYGSLCILSGYCALLLTSMIVTFITKLLPHESLYIWGWRLPFILGIILGSIGLYLRLKLPESPKFIWVRNTQRISRNPSLHLITQSPVQFIRAMGLVILHALGYYLLFIYFTTYAHIYLNVKLSTLLLFNTLSLLLMIGLIPVIGWLSDKIGRKFILIVGSAGILICSYFLFLALFNFNVIAILIVQLCFTILLALTSAVIPATLVELFPTRVRCTGVSLSYNLSATLFGGTAPFFVTLIIEQTGNVISPSFYLIFAAAITLFTIWRIEETYRKPLY